MTTKQIDFSKPLQTRAGSEVRIYITDGGFRLPKTELDNLDLVNKPIEHSITVAINFYRGVNVNFYPVCHSFLQEALANRESDCIATKEFTLTFTEGEGL